MSALLTLIADRIRQHGPLTVAEYVDFALYAPGLGYYARAEQRSGKAGDFFTSVDLGPLFGELLAEQFLQMWRVMGEPTRFDMVEAAAGNGRLTASILDAVQAVDPRFYESIRATLVERSDGARARHAAVLERHRTRVAASQPHLPERIEGVCFANELLDALPPHLVVMRARGLQEVFVTLQGGRLVTAEADPSTPRLQEYLARAGVELPMGCFGEINLAATEWMATVSRSLGRGFLLLVDYGHEAQELYSPTHAHGTLTTFRRHAAEGRAAGPGWLEEPGERDITSHVDLTSVRLAAEGEGLTTLGLVDQTYFLLGLGIERRVMSFTGDESDALRRRLALKTLLMPGGIGSTHKVLVFSRGVGRPTLRGLSLRGRLT